MPDDPRFVVQHHLATADHYDVRLEIDGVLVSWAVPKGPSSDPRVRRLAKRTGDHALEHAVFEGVLGVQRRGGGVVQVWDTGTFRTIATRDRTDVDAVKALADGHLSVCLTGHRMNGGYTFIRTGDDLWLMIKRRDEWADADAEMTGTHQTSVLTGRTMAQIELDGP